MSSSAAVAQVRRLLQFLESEKHHLTIDADVHVTDVAAMTAELRRRYEATPNYYHGRPISADEALAEMSLAGVDAALVWQNPAATVYAG
ncbi:MAG: hypothetical protein FJ399_13150, partial [Verrucomicrobia bacterium]|nr:hypothetical protein [Verrucomicrobiota bacterium]